MLNNVKRSLEQIETRTLDPIGYYPVASTATGGLRAALGVAEIVAGVAAAVFMTLAIVLSVGCILGEKSWREKIGQIYSESAFFMSHGVANLARAIVEAVPFLNMITLTYDGSLDGQLQKTGRYSYDIPPAYQAARN